MPEEFSWDNIQHLRKSHKISETMLGIDQLILMREALGLTQEQLAAKLSEDAEVLVERGTVSRWENGERVPRSENRQKLYKLLGIPPYAWGNTRSSSRQEKPSSHFWHVPYVRNPYFTDQRNLVHTLRERFTAKEMGATHQAISGLGGIGKTQLAIAYAYRYQDKYTTVLWVGASTKTQQLFTDLVRIGRLLHVPETQKDTPQQRTIVNEVLRWLQKKSGWLFILDNVEEDLEANEKQAPEEKPSIIERILTIRNNGHILLTTRSRALARRVQNFSLEEMPPEEGAQLLLLRDGQSSSPRLLSMASAAHREEALALSRLLGGLPLALEQARAYIEATGCGFTGYQHLYETYRKELLQSIAKGSRLEREYKESVATTWLISFRRVEQQLAVASDVLKLYAYLAPDAIPEEMLLKGAEKLDGSLHQFVGNRLLLNRVCEVLLNYSLIKRNTDEAVLSIHRLIQAVLQDSMEEASQRFWSEQAVTAVSHVLPPIDSAHWQSFQRYSTHAQSCLAWIDTYNMGSQEAAQLLLWLGEYVGETSSMMQSEHLLQQAFNLTSSFEPEHPLRLASINALAVLYFNQGRYQEAEPLLRAALKQNQEQVSLNTATCLNNLGELYYVQGRYAEAEPLLLQALDMRTQLAGTEDLSVATSLRCLGQIYAVQEKYEKALPLLERSLKIREQALEDRHPALADSLEGLAELYLRQLMPEKARPLYQQAAEIYKKGYGSISANFARCLKGLAETYLLQEQFEEAEPLFLEVIAIYDRDEGQADTDKAQALKDLAWLYVYHQERFMEAESLFLQALAIRNESVGIHPDTAVSYLDLGRFYVRLNNYPKAEPYYKQALRIYEQTNGLENTLGQRIVQEYQILLSAMEG